jgi:tRNA A-37 threonylcarbamoyl transferase component Bud32/tetratricopeptide (TPR) repeat protein
MSDSDIQDMLPCALALQLGLISRESLNEAIREQPVNPEDTDSRLADIWSNVVSKVNLDQNMLGVLRSLGDEFMRYHDNNAARSLASLSCYADVRDALETAVATNQRTVDTFSQMDDTSERTASLLDTTPPATDDVQASTKIDESGSSRFRIERQHAEGGLGVVYLAEDMQIGRTVALKEMKPKFAKRQSLQSRFVFEAEINGRLEHPGIVPVYSLEHHEDGRPYYTMRFVEGNSLKDAIRQFHSESFTAKPGQRTIELRKLLRHFVDVCNAIGYAHSRGVLHRDLKPSNVMLGQFGETLLIDWGLAKSVAGDASAHEGDALAEGASTPDHGATQVGAVLGTPAYMSPEQANGQITTLGPPTDVYGLGAILFELLTGRPPVTGKSTGEIVQKVTRHEIRSPRNLRADVPRPLDAICLKALAESPEERYASAIDLATDVEKWLADEPVAAYAEPWTDRAARTIRRNKTSVVAAAVLMMSLIGALAVINLIAREQNKKLTAARDAAQENFELATKETARAERNLQDSSQLALKLLDLAEDQLSKVPNTTNLRLAMTDEALRVFQSIYQQRPEDRALSADYAQVSRKAANLYRLLNRNEEARTLSEEALQILKGLTSDSTGDQKLRDRLAETLRDHSTILKNLREIEQAAKTLEQAQDVIGQLQAQYPDSSDYYRTGATVQLDLAGLQRQTGLLEPALNNASEAAIALRVLADGPEAAALDPPLLLLALSLQSELLRTSGRAQEAEAIMQDARRRARERVEENDDNNSQHTQARVLLESSRVYLAQSDKILTGLAYLDEAITSWQQLTKDYPAYAYYKRYLADSLGLRGGIYLQQNQLDKADDNLAQALRIIEPTVETVKRERSYLSVLAKIMANHARLAQARDDRDSANQWWHKAIEVQKEIVQQAPGVKTEAKQLEALEAELQRLETSNAS